MLCTAPGAGAPSPGHGLLCGVSELEESLGPQTLFSFYMQVVLTHHSHSEPCTQIFNLDSSAWRLLSRWREGLGVISLVCRINFPSGLVHGCGGELG